MARDKAYFEAEKRIEIARRSAASELDLSCLQLTELPDSLWQLTYLVKLDLGGMYLDPDDDDVNNQLKELPESLGKLTRLEWLDLNRNQLRALPEALVNLPNLKWLDLSENFKMIMPDSPVNLTQLQYLNLDRIFMEVLPDWLGNLINLEVLNLSRNDLKVLPDNLGNLIRLRDMDLALNKLTALPESLGNLEQLEELDLGGNLFTIFPEPVIRMKRLQLLGIGYLGFRFPSYSDPNSKSNTLAMLPDSIGRLTRMEKFDLSGNQLTDIPTSIAQLPKLQKLDLRYNPLNPDLAAAYKEGQSAVMAYLRAKAASQITLNEAKLILVGEGEVGKSCLLAAMRGDKFVEGLPTTHGIEIKPIQVTDLDTGRQITLNGWDFGGQRIYRPTHQLFFSAPAVYLVVWKPREGPQQGSVKEWIKLVKHREPEAKILVVATHGGPKHRQPDIDRQELWDIFGKETVIDFFFIDSKPDENGKRKGIEELKRAIARAASSLPEMGRTVPKRWQEVREILERIGAAYLPYERVVGICREHGMDDAEARLFVTLSHRMGHLIHYEHDPTLSDIVILKPDWLAIAISFVLDDEETHNAHGLVHFSRLQQLWNDPTRLEEQHYPVELHSIFLRLMERFDLSYRVAGFSPKDDTDPASLIAQLVPDNRPDEEELERGWPATSAAEDGQQVQICRIIDDRMQSAAAEGLFYQLIVRLHRYSLGRVHYEESIHWQRGLVLDDEYNGRALLEHIGNDVRITVRAAYPEAFLGYLTHEVKYLIENFWEGLRCDVMVPCIAPCGKNAPGTGLFEVQKLIDSKRKNRPEYPCPVCNEWQNIDSLLRNAPTARPITAGELDSNREVLAEIRGLRHQFTISDERVMGRFDSLDTGQKELLSKGEALFSAMMHVFADEAMEGPRLFSFEPVNRKKFDPRGWTRASFRLTLWCEHSHLPLPMLNGPDSKKGVYEIERSREWFKKAAPFLKVLTGTLILVLPVASSGIKLALDDTTYKAIEEQLDFGKEVIDASLSGSEKIGKWLNSGETTELEYGEMIRAHSATLRELQALLKAKDPSFGGLVRVMNKRQEFLWVHPQFEKDY
jgi:GTPase SAR1 family protein